MSSKSELAPPEYDSSDVDGRDLEYNRRYGTLVNQIGHAVITGEELVSGFWTPARLAKGIIDYKVRHPGVLEDVPALVADATEVAISIHAGTLAPERFESFEAETLRYPSLRRSHVIQPRDMITHNASDPALSKVAASKLRRYIDADDALFLAIGHGGTTAAMMVYLHYIRSRGSKGNAGDSVIYPVRFSSHKKNDRRPRLDPDEVTHLQELAADKSRVVVVDEDISSGTTIETAVAFFSKLLDADVVPVINSNGGPHGEAAAPIIGLGAILHSHS